MESVYSRFELYNFDSDARFQEGLTKLNSTVSNEDLLKLKIFFYNNAPDNISDNGVNTRLGEKKSVSPAPVFVSLLAAHSRFREILSDLPASKNRYVYVGDSRNVWDTWDVCNNFISRFVEPIDRTGYLESHAQSSTSDHVEDNCCNQANGCNSEKRTSPQTDTDAESVQDVQLSFAEVFHMIQAGEEIPGLKKLDIRPCNQLPTVSQMSRKLKPWEK